jgi:hypothetical protein
MDEDNIGTVNQTKVPGAALLFFVTGETLCMFLSWSLLRVVFKASSVSVAFYLPTAHLPVPTLAHGFSCWSRCTCRGNLQSTLLATASRFLSHLSPACKSQNHHRVQVQHASIVLPVLKSRTYTSMISKPSTPCHIY